jgi:hypothetical protein
VHQETEENHENPYNSFSWTKILTWNLLNKMQECYPLSCDVPIIQVDVPRTDALNQGYKVEARRLEILTNKEP